ncbi:hypothetical protein Droror1_Dr00020084 [Drosera rotundifolia]
MMSVMAVSGQILLSPVVFVIWEGRQRLKGIECSWTWWSQGNSWVSRSVIVVKARSPSFCEKAQALIHGDCHTVSVIVTQDSTQVIDPEFAFDRPMGFDIGAFLGNSKSQVEEAMTKGL